MKNNIKRLAEKQIKYCEDKIDHVRKMSELTCCGGNVSGETCAIINRKENFVVSLLFEQIENAKDEIRLINRNEFCFDVM